MMLKAEEQGQMVFHILQHDYHRPFVDGKANRANIEDQITIGLYAGEIPPLDEEDVDFVYQMVNELVSNAADSCNKS